QRRFGELREGEAACLPGQAVLADADAHAGADRREEVTDLLFGRLERKVADEHLRRNKASLWADLVPVAWRGVDSDAGRRNTRGALERKAGSNAKHPTSP